MSALGMMLSDNIKFGILEHYNDFSSERGIFANYSRNLKEAFADCTDDILQKVEGYFDQSLNVRTTASELLLVKLTECLNQIDELDNWYHFRTLLSKLEDKQAVIYLNAAIDQNIEPKNIVGAFRKQFYYQWIDTVLSNSPILSAFNRIS